MAESFNLLRRVQSLDIAPELSGYSGVVIFAGQDDEGNNIEYRAGDRTGTVLEITNEWGSQAQADAIYNKIIGFKYQPYSAKGSRIDPSVELGDAVTISDVYGGVFTKATTFGKHIVTDLEAPSKEEVEHEFQIQSPTNRQYERFTRAVRASLSITASQIKAEVTAREDADKELRASIDVNADNIKAKVSKTEGNAESDFWWSLQSDEWSVGSKEKTIFKVDKIGAEVTGTIRATGGEIGGFNINSNYLSYNQTWGGTNTTGIYIGQSGIQCGSKTNGVQITPSGSLYAESGYFRGNVSAKNIEYGGNYGTFSGSGISSGSIYTPQLSSGITTSLGYADFANKVLNGITWAGNILTGKLSVSGTMTVHGHKVGIHSQSVVTPGGKSITINYLGV